MDPNLYSPQKIAEEKEAFDAWTEEHKDDLRMYVLVRRDVLPLAHCGVQASHAVAEYVHYHQNDRTAKWVEKDKTLIMLEATADDIERKRLEFTDAKRYYQPFHEPDMSNCLTAMAFEPMTAEQGKKIFGKFLLLK